MEFAGWLVGDSEEVIAEETEIDVTGDVTVKASWKEKQAPVDPVGPDDPGKKDDPGKDDGKSQTVKAANTLKVKAKTGKITVKKGVKKGTYKLKIKVTAAGNEKFNAGSKTVVVKIRVK